MIGYYYRIKIGNGAVDTDTCPVSPGSDVVFNKRNSDAWSSDSEE